MPPEKVTTYLSYAPTENQSYRLQMLYSGSEDYRLNGNSAFGRRDVDSYTSVDLSGQWQMGSGKLALGIENLLNEDYYPLYAQLLRSGTNTSHIPARGRQLAASYTFNW